MRILIGIIGLVSILTSCNDSPTISDNSSQTLDKGLRGYYLNLIITTDQDEPVSDVHQIHIKNGATEQDIIDNKYTYYRVDTDVNGMLVAFLPHPYVAVKVNNYQQYTDIFAIDIGFGDYYAVPYNDDKDRYKILSRVPGQATADPDE